MKVAFSPCPNDTFLFAHYVTGRSVTATLADIQELNRLAKTGEFDLIKVSCAALPPLLDSYRVLPIGSAVGCGCGPLLIAKEPFPLEELSQKRVAIPGEETTAHLLLTRLAPKPKEKLFCPYNEIMERIQNGSVDAGVIIHEQRFTYQQARLTLIADLGSLWEGPIPLGCLIAKPEVATSIVEALDRSLQQAYQNPPMAYMRQHAQELSCSVIQQHVDLYVTEETRSLSPQGIRAISALIEKPAEEWLWN